jgi:hypothetical protein
VSQWRGIPSVPPTDATSSIFLQSIKENLENVIILLDPTKYGRAQNTAYLHNDITNINLSVDGVSARVTNETSARVSADNALAQQIQQLIVSGSSAVMTYAQTTAPSPANIGDIWFDTDDNNKVYRYSGSAWVAVDDLRTVANTAAISTEQTVRLNADNALASSITSLTSLVNTSDATLQANINSETTTRATADTALASRATTLEATVYSATDGNSVLKSRIATEETARASGDATNASAITSLTSTVGTKSRTFAQTSAPTATATGDLWIDTDDNNKLYRWSGTAWVAVDDSRIAVNIAAISTESTTRATADSALASSITSLTSTVNTNNSTLQANITSEATTRANADTALATRATALESTVNSGTDGNLALKSRIATEETARASGDATNASAITSLTSTVGTKSRTFAQTSAPTATATGDLWIDTDDSNKFYRWDGAAWVAVDDSRIAVNAAAITTEASTRATADTALASSITSLTSTVNTNNSTLTASINSEATTRANADSALSTSLTSLTSTVNGNTSSITTLQSTSATQAGEITNLNAQYGVTVSAGKVTGFKLNSSATTSEFIVQADKFQIENSTGVPFKVVGSDVYINDNKVQTASIVNNSVTVPVSAFTSAATTVTSTSGYTTVQTATITTAGEPVVIGVSLSAVSNGSLDALFLCGVFRGTTQLLGSTGFITAAPSYNKPIAFNLQDTPAAGTYTYTIQVYRYFSNPAFDVYNRSLTLLGAKK